MKSLPPISPGYRKLFPIQCWNDGSLSHSVFNSDDVLVCYVYLAGAATDPTDPEVGSLFAPAVDWFVPGSQSGYGQGQVVATIENADSALLVPWGVYTLDVYRALASTPTDWELIARLRLPVEAVYG